MGLRKQIVEIVERAEARIDAAIIGDVIAEISHRRRVDGRDPDGVDAEADQIVEPPLDPLEVAYAVTVRVLKGARIDLVDHARLPPERAHANWALFMWVMRPRTLLIPAPWAKRTHGLVNCPRTQSNSPRDH
jgi:hypothetical protein